MKKQKDCIMRGMEPTSITGVSCDYDACHNKPVYDVEWAITESKRVKKSLCREHTDLAIEESRMPLEFD